MKTIWKYTLDVTERQQVDLPVPHQVLSVEEQFGTVVLYALVDRKSPFVRKFNIWIIGTGHPIPSEVAETSTFLGTVKLNGGLMFHVFYD